MPNTYRRRRSVMVILSLVALGFLLIVNTQSTPVKDTNSPPRPPAATNAVLARDLLGLLPVKGRAPKTDYSRDQFGGGWSVIGGCDMRNIILHRDLTNVQVDDECYVTTGDLQDPYTGKTIQFTRGSDTSDDVQIDHVVALSDAWQKGAQQLSYERRLELANDPLELLAVDGAANQQKSDGDAATWLPSYKPFRCQYVARQIAVKYKYELWVTQAEYNAMEDILDGCPGQTVPAN